MVKLTRIYTRGGDRGETSLGDGTRVAKHDLRVAAFGTVDEAKLTTTIDATLSAEAAYIASAAEQLYGVGKVKGLGAGQTEAEVTHPLGRHKLQLLLGDANHVPHDPPVMSAPITVTVTKDGK